MTEPSGGSTDKPRRPVVVPAIALTAFTVVGITALLGGLSEAPDEPETLSPGAVLDQGRYSTKFVGSRVTVQKGEFDWEEDKRFVELVFDVVNLGDDTSGIGMPPEKLENAVTAGDFAGSLLKITPAFSKDAGPFTFVRVKGGESRQLHPGVRSEVVLRYQLKENEQPPEKITLDVGAFEYSADPVAALPYWSVASKEVGDKQMPEVKARVVLPVKKEGTT